MSSNYCSCLCNCLRRPFSFIVRSMSSGSINNSDSSSEAIELSPTSSKQDNKLKDEANREGTPPVNEESPLTPESADKEATPPAAEEKQGIAKWIFSLTSKMSQKSLSTGPSMKDRWYWDHLPLEEKREQYKCGRNYVSLDQIPSLQQQLEPDSVDQTLSSKVSMWRGDITRLEIDAIVNAANSSLLGGGGVDGAIHRAASHSLYNECRTLNGCRTGQAKITGGHRLPAKYILHTVGPMDGDREALISCYESCLSLVQEHKIRSVAFCCIATGVYGYPNEEAAHVALGTVNQWLIKNSSLVDRIIFCVFLDIDRRIYSKLLPQYFAGASPDELETTPSPDLANSHRELRNSDPSKPDDSSDPNDGDQDDDHRATNDSSDRNDGDQDDDHRATNDSSDPNDGDQGDEHRTTNDSSIRIDSDHGDDHRATFRRNVTEPAIQVGRKEIDVAPPKKQSEGEEEIGVASGEGDSPKNQSKRPKID